MADIDIRVQGQAGRITLQRPEALNALTYQMVLDIETAIDAWRADDGVRLILIDAKGDKAFCAGGDIAEMYASGKRGDFDYGRQFWRDEYRLNAKLAEYPKPMVSFLHGFTMGGGVGVGCHGSHRIVGETSRIAMPECGIGLVPDVGGTFLLSRAPGYLGTYLGVTSARMDGADAIYAGFADHFIPQEEWLAAKDALCNTGQTEVVLKAATAPTASQIQAQQPEIDALFADPDIGEIADRLAASDSELAGKALKPIHHNAPLAMACAVEIINRMRGGGTIRDALDLEYRYTHRTMAQGDFIEGIRAAIIDRDRAPTWAHATPRDVAAAEVAAMLAPLEDAALNWEDMP